MTAKGKTRRIGLCGYAHILRAVIDHADTRARLLVRCKLGRSAGLRIFNTLHRLRIFHIFAWETMPRGRWLPVYAFGARADAPLPARRPNGDIGETGPQELSPFLSPQVIGFVTLLRALEQPASVVEMALATGIAECTLRRVITCMRGLGLVRVGEWRSSWAGSGSPTALYEFAIDQRDAPRPRRKSRKAINLRYRMSRAALAQQRAMTFAPMSPGCM